MKREIRPIVFYFREDETSRKPVKSREIREIRTRKSETGPEGPVIAEREGALRMWQSGEHVAERDEALALSDVLGLVDLRR